jgi:hypothetical protein
MRSHRSNPLLTSLPAIVLVLMVSIQLHKRQHDSKDQPQPPTTLPSTMPATAPAMSNEEIADRVEKTLRNAVYLEVASTITQVPRKGNGPSYELTIKSQMAKNLFKTKVFRNKKLSMVLSLREGKIQEYHPPISNRQLTEYDAPFPHGTDHEEYTNDDDCLIGKFTFSWVGVPELSPDLMALDTAGSMAMKISMGDREKDVVEGDQDCFVFRKKTPMQEAVIEDVVYVSKKDFVVLRWDTFQPDFQRIRTYRISIKNSVPSDVSWTIDPTNLDEP